VCGSEERARSVAQRLNSTATRLGRHGAQASSHTEVAAKHALIKRSVTNSTMRPFGRRSTMSADAVLVTDLDPSEMCSRCSGTQNCAQFRNQILCRSCLRAEDEVALLLLSNFEASCFS